MLITVNKNTISRHPEHIPARISVWFLCQKWKSYIMIQYGNNHLGITSVGIKGIYNTYFCGYRIEVRIHCESWYHIQKEKQ